MGDDKGRLHIWNIRSKQRVFTSTACKSGGSVTAVVQSPVVDTLGVGTSDGSIFVHNLRADKVHPPFRDPPPPPSISPSPACTPTDCDHVSAQCRSWRRHILVVLF